VVLASITTVFFLGFLPQDSAFQAQHPIAAFLGGIVDLVLLVYAIRYWTLVLRRRVELHLSPQGLTIRRGSRQATVPWTGVTRLRVGGPRKRPWLIACLACDLADIGATLAAGDALPARARWGTVALAGATAVVGAVLIARTDA